MDEYIDFLPTCSACGKTLSCVVDVAPAMEDITVGQDIRYLKVKGYEIVPCLVLFKREKERRCTGTIRNMKSGITS